MTNFAYLRVSTDTQDLNNQKVGVVDYAKSRDITIHKFIIEENVSGTIDWRKREIGKIFDKAVKGDIVLTSEISRLSRTTLQVLEILKAAAEKEIAIHIIKGGLIMDGSLSSTITATILGLAADIERQLISSRTKDALAKRKADGFKLGRPKGEAENLKLDIQSKDIDRYLMLGINKVAIAKLVSCTPATLYSWLKKRKNMKFKRKIAV
jgi:DNA invertase Pin-like site-specific DNA recombinase